MRFVLRLIRIVFTLLLFGVDEVAMSAFPQRSIRAALMDPRPLSMHAPAVRTAARDLAYTLDQLERWLLHARRAPRRVRAPAAVP